MTILAHQGGWDEFLLVLVPLTGIALLLRMAKKRADRSTPTPSRPDADPAETRR